MADVISMLKVIIVVQLFYAMSITILAYSMPADSLTYVDGFGTVADDIGLEDVATDLEDNLNRQRDIPVVELGSLVFYSGNILVDLLLNFMFAIPQMIGLVLNGLVTMFNFDPYIWQVVELFAAVVVVALYVLGMIQMLINLRGRGSLA